MPLVNVYFKKGTDTAKLQPHVAAIKDFLADKMSGDDIQLTPAEISVRFLNVVGGEMIADIEIDIAAHAFGERVKNQDAICVSVMEYVKEIAGVDIKVWLKLSELGHSW